MAGTWDTVHGDASLYTFSSGNLVATDTPGSGFGDVIKGLDNLTSTSGLRIAEIKWTGTTGGAGNVLVGIGDGTATTSLFSSLAAYVSDTGAIFLAAGHPSAAIGVGFVTGDSVLIAIDETNQLFWFGIWHPGSPGTFSGWNSSGAGDPTNPSTGGGFTTNGAWPASLAIYVRSGSTTDNVFTYRVTAASFSTGLNYPAPTGYLPWYSPVNFIGRNRRTIFWR